MQTLPETNLRELLGSILACVAAGDTDSLANAAQEAQQFLEDCPAPNEDRPVYGWGWIDGEDDDAGSKWIQISTLDYSGDVPCLGDDEVCVLMLHNYDESVQKYPGIMEDHEAKAKMIVDGLNRFYGNHTITVEVEGGCCTDVRGLPDGWDYEIEDYDSQACGEQLDQAELADQQRQFDKFSPPPE